MGQRDGAAFNPLNAAGVKIRAVLRARAWSHPWPIVGYTADGDIAAHPYYSGTSMVGRG